jgi:hypothetical protein
MAIIDDFKSEKNRNLIIQASTKMLLYKYNLSLNPDIMINIINTIITSMSKDAILMNNTVKLMELNTITLTKMKDYVNKNLDDINVSVSTPIVNANEENIYNDVPKFNKDDEINKNDIFTNEELLIKVKDYENKRNIANTILVNIDNMEVSGEKNTINAVANNKADPNKLISEIIEKVFETMNKNINKKTLIINSYCRDWISNPQRNKLNFSINIDLQNNIIEPFKILFPKYVKDITPYIKLVITDNHQTYKFNFIYSKSSGKWDIWELMNKDNIHINLANKNWKINFYDYINNELKLGNDDIKISQINDFKMNHYDDNTENHMNIDTNIDNILTTHQNDIHAMNDMNDMNDNCKNSKDKNKMTFYELNIDYSNIMEYDEYNLNMLCKYDYIQLKTSDNKYVNVKVIDVNNNQGKIIISNENNLRKEDFANSSILNYGAQYSIILTYYHKQ